MSWTAILERDGRTSAISFNFHHDAEDALANITKVVECDGFKVIGLIKGDQAVAFYGIDSNTNEIIKHV